jgi:hypothetical protein
LHICFNCVKTNSLTLLHAYIITVTVEKLPPPPPVLSDGSIVTDEGAIEGRSSGTDVFQRRELAVPATALSLSSCQAAEDTSSAQDLENKSWLFVGAKNALKRVSELFTKHSEVGPQFEMDTNSNSNIPFPDIWTVLHPIVAEKLDNPGKILSLHEKILCVSSCVKYGVLQTESAKGRDGILLLGDTGAGKSTFANYVSYFLVLPSLPYTTAILYYSCMIVVCIVSLFILNCRSTAVRWRGNVKQSLYQNIQSFQSS